jgi:glycosyltransferase involved in cell wall biosynthesis
MTADAVGGVWTYALELAAGLAAEDVEVVLAVLGPPPSAEQRQRLDVTPLTGYDERPYALEWMDDPADEVRRSAAWLLGLEEELRPDLIHLNGYALGAVASTAARLIVGHSCLLSWHEAVRRVPAGREWSWYREVVRTGLERADALVAPTHAMLGELERLYEPTCPREVIRNGLGSKLLRPSAKQPFVLGVGRAWDEGKNLGALERVAARLDWPVLVAGDGGRLGRISADRLDELYRSAAVFAAPGKYEPFGLAALEAARSGCALVLGDLPTQHEIWGDAALYVDPFDDDAIASALAGLIGDDELRATLAGAARRRSRAYTRRRMTAAYVDLYERLVTDRVAAEGLAR